MSDERGQNRISPMDGQKDRSVWLFMGLGFVVSGTPGCRCTGFLCQGWAIECVATCLFGRVNGLLQKRVFPRALGEDLGREPCRSSLRRAHVSSGCRAGLSDDKPCMVTYTYVRRVLTATALNPELPSNFAKN